MNNLKDYVKVYNFLDKSFCNKIISELNKTKDWDIHKFYNPATKITAPKDKNKELDVSFANISLKNELTQKVWECIKYYISLKIS